MLKPRGHRSFGNRIFRRLRRELSRLPYSHKYADAKLLHGTTELHPFAKLDAAGSVLETEKGVKVEIDARPRSKAMADLIRRIGHDGRIRHVRDERFLDWRFHNPLCEYRFLYAGGEALDGYLVLQRLINHPQPYPRVRIVDLEAVNVRVQAALLRTAVRAGAFTELVTWTATANDALLKELDRLGFGPIDREAAAFGCPCFLIRPTSEQRLAEDWRLGNTLLLDLKNWDIRMLFSMAG
jgi:hypothetical protein